MGAKNPNERLGSFISVYILPMFRDNFAVTI